MRTTLLLCFAVLLLLPACSPKVYEADNMEAIIADHQIIAIIPPTVAIKGRPKDDPEQLALAAREDTYTFQREMYSWILRRKEQGKIRRLEIMDPETTNIKLERAGYTLDNRVMTPAELAETLGVDAVIITRFNTSKPMSEGASLALGILIGAWGTTNSTKVNVDIHDATQGLIWNYDWEANGSNFNSPESLVDGLMRNMSKRMPYTVN